MSNKIHILCQPEYFRQCIFDLLWLDSVEVSWITSGDPNTIRMGLDRAKSHRADIVIFFRPEWLVPFHEEIKILRRNGLKIIGISSEPVGLDWQTEDELHADQLLRLNNLKYVNDIDIDLLVHYDDSSVNTVRSAIRHKVVSRQLPLSSKLFNVSDVSPTRDFDSIFLGRSTEYREKYLVYPKMLHRHLHVAHGLTDEYAVQFIKKSHVSLNIHNLEYLGYEVRVLQSLMCGTPVISEPLTRDDFCLSRGLVFVDSHEQLRDVILHGCIETPIYDEVFEHWQVNCDAAKWVEYLLSNLS